MYQQHDSDLEWQKSPTLRELPDFLGEWLLYSASFMKKLQQYGVSPRIKVLRQHWKFPTWHEKQALHMKTRAYALIREVLIYSEGKKWMYARTVFPRQTLTGQQRCLARLKTRSLGSILFKDPTLERDPFDVTCLLPEMPFHQFVTQQANIIADAIWGRRSRFVLRGKPLLLSEFFLPDIMQITEPRP